MQVKKSGCFFSERSQQEQNDEVSE